MAGSKKASPCECCDPGCPVHPGGSCQNMTRTKLIYRVDMEDRTGTAMCPRCLTDAMNSGVFSDQRVTPI